MEKEIKKKEKNWRDCEMKNSTAGFTGCAFWFAGWLFTLGFANLVWWKAILGIVVWPFYLGDIVLALP
jgi:hypothetical protein